VYNNIEWTLIRRIEDGEESIKEDSVDIKDGFIREGVFIVHIMLD
jgi:hypothetical protein